MKDHRRHIAIVTAIAALFAGVTLGIEARGDALSCWAPEALRAKPGEKRVKRIGTPHHSGKADQLFGAQDFGNGHAAQPPLSGVVRRVTLPQDKKWIALTLDFCEQLHEVAGYDGEIIDYLRDQNISATLFMGGKWMRTHPERTQQLMADTRFELANHGDLHRDLRRSTRAQMTEEINGPNTTYANLRAKLFARQCFETRVAPPRTLQPRLQYFRFPYGTCNPSALQQVHAHGLTAVQWDFSSWDSARTQTAKKIARRMVRGVRSGSIILAHANGRGYHTADALKLAVPKLRAKGFRFVTLSTLLAAGKPVIVSRCYNVRPGDTDRTSLRRKTRKTKRPVRGSSWSP